MRQCICFRIYYRICRHHECIVVCLCTSTGIALCFVHIGGSSRSSNSSLACTGDGVIRGRKLAIRVCGGAMALLRPRSPSLTAAVAAMRAAIRHVPGACSANSRQWGLGRRLARLFSGPQRESGTLLHLHLLLLLSIWLSLASRYRSTI